MYIMQPMCIVVTQYICPWYHPVYVKLNSVVFETQKDQKLLKETSSLLLATEHS